MSMSLTSNATQATQIEQVRAAAEVAAAIQVAQQFPRTPEQCLGDFLKSCGQLAFAERSFFRFRRGSESVTGVTIAFAQEAARCWRNMQSGSIELERRATESDMIAFAWDVEMNTRRSSTFVNPHLGYTDTPKKDDEGKALPPRKLVAVRDIRENNASAAARLEREMILAVLPTWYIEAGKDKARETVAKKDDDKPIEVRRQALVDWFLDRLNVRLPQLEDKLGLPVSQWSPQDLANLGVIGKSIRAGETTLDTEFPTTRGGNPAIGTGEAPAGSTLLKDSHKLRNEIFALLGQAGVTGRGQDEKRRKIAAVLLGKPVNSFTELTEVEGIALRDQIRKWGDGGDAIAAQLLEEADKPVSATIPSGMSAETTQFGVALTAPDVEDTPT